MKWYRFVYDLSLHKTVFETSSKKELEVFLDFWIENHTKELNEFSMYTLNKENTKQHIKNFKSEFVEVI